jgi:hypothetical protein
MNIQPPVFIALVASWEWPASIEIQTGLAPSMFSDCDQRDKQCDQRADNSQCP